MSAFPLDINEITADKASNISEQAEISRAKAKAGLKGKTKAALEGDLEMQLQSMHINDAPPPVAAPKAKKARAAPKMTREDVKVFHENMKEVEKSKDEKDVARLVVKVQLYQALMPRSCDGIKISPNPSKAELEGVLKQIRARNSLQNLKPNATQTLCLAIQFAEVAVHDWGYNPMGFRNIRGFAKMIERNPELIETELTEMAIELHWLFEQGWYVRLGLKLGRLMKEYDEKRVVADAASKPVPADLEERFGAL